MRAIITPLLSSSHLLDIGISNKSSEVADSALSKAPRYVAPIITERNSYEDEKKKIQALQSDQTRLAKIHQDLQGEDSLNNTPHPLATAAPSFTKALGDKQAQLQDFIIDSFPKDPNNNPLQANNSLWQPSESQMEEYFNKANIALKPSIIMDKLHDGILTKSDVDTFKMLYPQLYQNYVDNVTARLATLKKDISIDQKNQLSILLGKPLDASQDQECNLDFVWIVEYGSKDQW